MLDKLLSLLMSFILMILSLFGGSGEAVWDYRQMQNADTLIQRFRTFLSREECHRGLLEQKLFRMQHPMEMAGIKEFA